MDTTHQLDLGIADVHAPTSIGESAKRTVTGEDDDEPLEMRIDAATRKNLPLSKFAWPEKRKYPLDKKERVKAAASYLVKEHNAGKVPDDVFPKAKARIRRAAKRFGIETELSAQEGAGSSAFKRRTIHIRADLAPGGSMHVRHMKERAFYDAEGVTLSEAHTQGEGPVWIQIAKQGAFAGHAAGPFKLDVSTFSEIIHNFKSTTNRAIPIDYEHASEQDPTQGSIPTSGAPAQGWIRDLKIEDGNLWGKVEWLPQARDQIRAGAYKFLSPAIRFDSKDRVTGKPIGARLTSAALTNMPFLDGMEPLAAKDAAAPGAMVAMRGGGASQLVHSPHQYMPAIRAALKMPDLSSHQECADKLDRVRDLCMTYGMDGMYDGQSMSDYSRPLSDLVGATPGMSLEELFDCVEDLIAHAIAQHNEEMHGAGMADRPEPSKPATQTTDEDVTMDQAAELRDAKGKVTTLETTNSTLEGKLKTVEGELTTLKDNAKTLGSRAETAETTLKDVGALVTLKDSETLLGAIKRIVEENTQLLADKATRDETDLKADVETAFDTYKDAKGLKEADKVTLTDIARSNRAAFNKMYPPIPASERHLLRGPLVPAARRPKAVVTEQSLNARAHKLMAERGLTWMAARDMAARELREEAANGASTGG
jgi:hypothetical protein